MTAFVSRLFHCLTDYSEKQDRTLCTGCQAMKNRLFDPQPLRTGRVPHAQSVQRAERLIIHQNYSELSKCADTICDLCKFIRRELCFYSYDNVHYAFSNEDLQDLESDVHVWFLELYDEFRETEDRGFEFCHGAQIGGPAHSLHGFYLFQKPTLRKPREGDTDIESLFNLSRQWLTTCRTMHQGCGPQNRAESAYLPTRLLDVGQLGQETIQLILSKDLAKTEGHNYVTLNYCWGSANDTARTTKQNMAQRLRAISIGNLPKTIQDAIRVTRALGVRFLWVDALCIVQVQEGRNEDWERELPNMGKIYRHSVLTIAASSAKSSEGGLFHRRRAARWPVENYYLENNDEVHAPGSTGVLLKPSLPIWELAVDRSALAQRGWVLQEQMLASRTLSWTEDGLFWHCAELSASEYEEEMEKWHRLPTLQALAQDIVEVETTRRTRSVWTKLLEEFSQKMLTVATDRLPAVEGLGTEVSRLTGKKMVKGVWPHNLVHELAWMADFSKPYYPFIERHPKPARLPNMPSWSWASVDAKLRFRGPTSMEKPKVQVTNCFLEGDRLHVRARLGVTRVRRTKLRIQLHGQLCCHPTPCTFEPVTARPEEDGKQQVAILDTLADTLDEGGGTILCIQWVEWTDNDRSIYRKRGVEGAEKDQRVTGALIVTPVDANKNIFCRIGWLEVVDTEFFDEEPQDFILV